MEQFKLCFSARLIGSSSSEKDTQNSVDVCLDSLTIRAITVSSIFRLAMR